MSTSVFDMTIAAAQIIIAIALLCAAVRLMIGPRAQDRVLAMDTLYVNALLMILTYGLRTGNVYAFEAALVIGVLGFVSTTAMAKFLLRGEVIE